MIHSMCGGGLKDNAFYTFVKVEFLDCPICEKRPYWFICPFKGVKKGDKVRAPFGKSGGVYTALVIRADENVSEQTPPFPISSMSELCGVIKE